MEPGLQRQIENKLTETQSLMAQCARHMIEDELIIDKQALSETRQQIGRTMKAIRDRADEVCLPLDNCRATSFNDIEAIYNNFLAVLDAGLGLFKDKHIPNILARAAMRRSDTLEELFNLDTHTLEQRTKGMSKEDRIKHCEPFFLKEYIV